METLNKKYHARWSAVHECWRHKLTFAIVISLATVLAIVTANSIPEKYAAFVKLADERKQEDILIGKNMDNFSKWIEQVKHSQDQNVGISNPLVYASLIDSRDFTNEISETFIPCKGTTYKDYLQKNYKTPWWSGFISKDEEDYNEIFHDNIKCEASSKYETLLIRVTDEDPVVAAQLADSVTSHLQEKISALQKIKIESLLNDARSVMLKAKQSYDIAQKNYSDYSDEHQDAILQGEKTEIDALQKKRDEAFERYESVAKEFARQRALITRKTVAFEKVYGPSVPNEPYAPNMLAYIFVFDFIAFVLTVWCVLLRKKITMSNINKS